MFNLKKWAKGASCEELQDKYDEYWKEWIKGGGGEKSKEMEIINEELSEKSAARLRAEHPEAYNPNNHWTDANRWE